LSIRQAPPQENRQPQDEDLTGIGMSSGSPAAAFRVRNPSGWM